MSLEIGRKSPIGGYSDFALKSILTLFLCDSRLQPEGDEKEQNSANVVFMIKPTEAMTTM